MQRKFSSIKLLAYAVAFFCAACGKALTFDNVKSASVRHGAGFVFVCTEEPSILLAQRSEHVPESGTWAGLGGISEPNELPEDTAKREVIEEAGSMPKFDRILARLSYEKDGLVFVTFIADLSKEEKRRWRPKRNFENDAIEWFDQLPNNIHPGLTAAIEKHLKEVYEAR